MRRFAPIVLGGALAACAHGASVQQQQQRPGAVRALVVSGPETGRKAPEFSLPWATKDSVGPAGSPYSLWRDRGKTVVLAFYPRDFTRSSTVQMCTFAQRYDSLFGPDVVVVGIGAEPLESHRRFAASLNLPFRLLSDPSQRVARLYGSGDPSGYNRRTVYVIGPDGLVRYRDMRFEPLEAAHYAALRDAVRTARNGGAASLSTSAR